MPGILSSRRGVGKGRGSAAGSFPIRIFDQKLDPSDWLACSSARSWLSILETSFVAFRLLKLCAVRLSYAFNHISGHQVPARPAGVAGLLCMERGATAVSASRRRGRSGSGRWSPVPGRSSVPSAARRCRRWASASRFTRTRRFFYSLIESAKLAGVEPRAYHRRGGPQSDPLARAVTLGNDLE